MAAAHDDPAADKDLTERAVHLLVANRSNGGVRYEALPFELVVRESTAPPATAAA